MKVIIGIIVGAGIGMLSGFLIGWEYNHANEFLPNQLAWEFNFNTQAHSISLLAGKVSSLENQLHGSKLRIEKTEKSLRSAELNYTHQIDGLNGQIDGLNGQLQVANQDLIAERGKLSTWFELTDVQGQLAEVSELESQIHELKRQRTALVPQKRIVPLACTGSMEPAINCKDVVTVISNPTPDDITIGAVVTYWTETSKPRLYGPQYIALCSAYYCPKTSLGCHGEFAQSLILHRVIATRTINGEKHYRMKGDANYSHDGCWVPFKNIIEYVVEIDKRATCWSWEKC